MYRLFIRALCGVCLLFSFWPVLRLFGVTIFDCLTPLAIIFGLTYEPEERGPPFASFGLAVAGVGLLAVAGAISYPSSNDAVEHLQRIVNLVIALGGITGFAFVLANRRIFTVIESLSLLCVSATLSSIVCIMQGRLGILTHLIPKATQIEAWTRMTGLAEHPIEAGISSAFGIILALGLGIHWRKWTLCIPAIGVNLLALMYSASLTAVFAFLLASVVVFLFSRAYKAFGVAIVCGALGLAAAVSYTGFGLLTSRLDALVQNQGNYATVKSREMQWAESIGKIEPATIAVGNGYSIADLPAGREIHNGLVASVFHFGILGLLSQLFMIAFFVTRLRHQAPRDLKAILFGCIVIFTMSYMTGPALSRRSLWVPLIVLGGYLTAQTVSATKALKIRKLNLNLDPTGGNA